MASLSCEHAKTFLNLANAMVGFCIAQTLTFMIAVGTHQGALAKILTTAQGQMTANWAIGISLALYAGVLLFCQHATTRLQLEASAELNFYLRCWNGLRLIIVALLTLACYPIVHSVKNLALPCT